jgi:hypothetical protein
MLAAVIPVAFVMVAGPQIVTAIFLATGKRWLRNSLLFLSGVAAATTVGTGVAYFGYAFLKQGVTTSKGESIKLIAAWACVALLLFLAFRVYRKRGEKELPRWMAGLQGAGAAFSFKIGFLLFLLMPSDVVTMVTVGAHLGRCESAYWQVLAFVAATVFLAGTPLILDLFLGKRAETVLPRLRDWMNANSWIVSELLIAIFLVMMAKGILQAT